MTISDLKSNNCLLFECISGSRAYGLHLPDSDTDIKGVFVLPQKQFYGLHYIEQLSNEKYDKVYYELRRFAELLCKSNPSAAGTKYRDIKWSLLSPYYVPRCSHSPAIIAPRALYGNKIATFYYPVT